MKEAGRSIFFTLFLALLVICFTPAFATSDGDEDIFTQDYMRLSGLADQGAVASQVVDWDGDTCYAYLSDMSVCTYRTGVGLEKLCTLPPAPEALYLTYEPERRGARHAQKYGHLCGGLRRRALRL